jgi:hypothetical protein
MVDKHVKKQVKKKLYLSIILSIKRKKCLPKDISKQRLNYYVKSLKANNLIVKRGYGVWELTALGEKYLFLPQSQGGSIKVDKRSKKISNETIRSHAYIFKIKHKKRLLSTERLKKPLEMKNIEYKQLRRKEISFKIKGTTVTVGKRHVVMYFSSQYSYFSDSAITNDKFAKHDAKNIIISVKRLLGLDLDATISFSRKHHGHVNNEIAKECKNEKKSFTIEYEGDPWLSVDASNGVPELEAISSLTATYDSEFVIKKVMNTFKANPNILDDQQKTIQLLTENLRMLTERICTTEPPQSLNKLTYIQ